MATTHEHAEDSAPMPPPAPSSSSAIGGKAKIKTKDADEDKETKEDAKEERTVKPERIQPEALRELRRGENQELADYLTQLRGTAPIQIAVHRLKPAVFAGKQLKGHIETIEETITEDEMRDRWGGGQYQLKVKRRNDQGSWVFLTSTVVDIAGDPRTDNLPGGTPQNGNPGPSMAAIQADADTRVAQHAMNMLERQATEMRDMLKRDTGFDPKMIAAMMAPFEAQMKAMQEELRRKDDQMKSVLDKPSDPFQQKLLEKFVDGDSARINALRTQHESEVRTIKESHAADLKRIEDRFDRERAELKRDYDRQIDNLKNGYERELTSLKTMHQQLDIAANSSNSLIKTSLERDIARIERENVELRAENKALREKKDQSLLDKAKEIDQLKEVLGIDGEDGGKDKTAFERVIDTALQSEQLLNFVGRWAGPAEAKPGAAPAQAQQQQQLQQTPPKFVRNKRTGEVGQWNPATQQYERVQRRGGGNGGEPAELQIPPEHLQMAITILERSYANKTPPKNFAATISTALPPEIYQAIRDHGVDGFVNKVAKLGASSPLRRQDGINWLREVGKILIGDDDPSPGPDDDQVDDIDGDALNDAPE